MANNDSKGHRRWRSRIPIFRIFYNFTYSIIYLICVVFLAITPITMLYDAIEHRSFQYVLFIGGTYILTLIIAIVFYSSRIYTNRSVMAAVGKPYIPIEKGEVGTMVRKMIVKQLESNAVVAWEGRPRDLFVEGYMSGGPPDADDSMSVDDHNARRRYAAVGTKISLDPHRPPWGRVRHVGWSSPSGEGVDNIPNLQFANVVSEMPHLIEAHAVSLAPAEQSPLDASDEIAAREQAVMDILRRPANMGVREYLAYLSSFGLVQSPLVGQAFLSRYEKASFSGVPASESEFYKLMAAFSDLLADMSNVDLATLERIRVQALEMQAQDERDSEQLKPDSTIFAQPVFRGSGRPQSTHSSVSSPSSSRSLISPVTAREAPSRNLTPYLQQQQNHQQQQLPVQSPALESMDSLASVIHTTPRQMDDVFGVQLQDSQLTPRLPSFQSPSLTSLPSDAGSVIHRSPNG